jgi:hypothetical protein
MQMTLKNFYLTISAILIVSFSLQAQNLELPGMDASPMDAAHYPPEAAYRNYLEGEAKETKELIKILYSRPQKKGRNIFGELVPYGQLWRLGANEGTEITFYGPVEINNTLVEPGTYTVNAEIYPDQWIMKFSTERFIAGSDNLDPSKVVLSAAVPTIDLSNAREALTMGFQKISDNSCNLVVEWDRTRVELPIQLNPADLSPMDASPMDLAQYPSMSRYMNFMESDEEKAANQPKVRVVYSRPQKKGRKIFGGLVKYDALWRLGANESTEITFFEDMMIGGKEVKAGTYGLLAIVKEDGWDFIVHKGIPSWGEFGHDDKNNVATVSGPVEMLGEEAEALTMAFEEIDENTLHLIVAWDKTMARMPIKVK